MENRIDAKVGHIFQPVQLFPANQLRLSADSVQAAAFLS